MVVRTFANLNPKRVFIERLWKICLRQNCQSANWLFMQRQVQAFLPTDWGNFNIIAYATSPDDLTPHVALVHENLDTSQPVLVRIHSECMTGDLFHSRRCDCGEQLDKALELAAEHHGVVIYLRQEGRGIGLINKLKAYNLQDKGFDTASANTHLGFEVDARQYDLAVEILHDLGIRQIRLLTNNPLKIEAIEHSGIEITGREPLIIEPKKENAAYLRTKRELMGHLLGR
jgi:GTP cyclohydrolase II